VTHNRAEEYRRHAQECLEVARVIALAKAGNLDPILLRDQVVKSFGSGPATGH
jgi:hypothetical protein